MEDEALGDVPTTYDELFDFVEQWLDSDLASEYTLFGPMTDTFGFLLRRILGDYIALSESQQQTLPFHDEKLLHLLARLRSSVPSWSACQCNTPPATRCLTKMAG